LQKNKMTYSEFAEKANRGGAELQGEGANEAVNAFGLLKGITSMENPHGYNDKDITAQVGEMVGIANPNATPEAKARAQAELEKRDRMGDKMEAAGAVGEDAARKSLNVMSDDLKKAADAASHFADVITNEANRVHADAEANRNKQPHGSGFNTDLTGRFNTRPMPGVQPTGGVPKQ
jgi:hypothetical protein